MVLPTLLLAACAALPVRAAERPPEERLRTLLAGIRQKHVQAAREAVLGSAQELRDSVASETGPAKKRVMNRLPGMAAEPFGLCRDLARCPEAPLSLHVEDDALLDDAFLAVARPWLNLQKARGKAVAVTVEAGVGVRLELQDLPAQPVVTLEAEPAPTGGFDVTLREGPAAALVYSRERAALLPKNE